jgi:hypothetical protein
LVIAFKNLYVLVDMMEDYADARYTTVWLSNENQIGDMSSEI